MRIIPRHSRQQQLSILVVALCSTPATITAQQQQISDYDCNYYEDTCVVQWQLDGTCDSALNGCRDQDCWDCDPCQVHDTTSCLSCTASGECVWCPGDGVCRSQALGAAFWDSFPTKISACPLESDWMEGACAHSSSNNNVYSDPLYDAMQWSYDLIHVEAVWRQQITGHGVHVRVNDIGMDAHHAEFAGRFSLEESCPSFASSDSSSSSQAEALHGTGVASILAASGNNDLCSVGIAPNVTLSACTFRPDAIDDELAVMLASQLQGVDISTNAWGPEVCTNLNYVRARWLQSSNNNNNDNDAEEVCLFDATHPDAPCAVCASSSLLDNNNNNNNDDNNSDNISAACASAIDDYCTSHYDNDEVACAEFLDFYVSCEYHALPQRSHQVFVEGVLNGRSGNGIIYVFAAGNSHEVGGFTNTDGFINSRFTISVGAVDKYGRHASYSTVGAALLVVAPGGDFEFVSNNAVASPGGGCSDITAGTSFSAPVVAGVIALLLEVNPNLGWRDVQAVLAETAQQTDAEDASWSTNGASLPVSYKYGFGLVDAEAAVLASRSWINFGPEQQLVLKSDQIDLEIVDSAESPTRDSHLVEASGDFRTESVVLYLDLLHASRGDLLITLTSPSGTESILHPSKRPENRQLPGNETWKLMTLRNWNENPSGEWQLFIVDESPGIRDSCANKPFEYIYQNRDGYYGAYNCLDAEASFHCSDGQVMQDEIVAEAVDRGRNNRTAADACCICGGGVPVTEVNKLRSWTMVIYGHDSSMQEEEATKDNQDDDATSSPPAPALDSTSTTSPVDIDGSTNNATISNTIATTEGNPDSSSNVQGGEEGGAPDPNDLIAPTETDDSATTSSSNVVPLAGGGVSGTILVMSCWLW